MFELPKNIKNEPASVITHEENQLRESVAGLRQFIKSMIQGMVGMGTEIDDRIVALLADDDEVRDQFEKDNVNPENDQAFGILLRKKLANLNVDID